MDILVIIFHYNCLFWTVKPCKDEVERDPKQMWKDTHEETYLFLFYSILAKSEKIQIRRKSSDYDSDFLLHIPKLIWGLEMTIYTVWWK